MENGISWILLKKNLGKIILRLKMVVLCHLDEDTFETADSYYVCGLGGGIEQGDE